MGRSKRERRGRVAKLPDGIEWWLPRPGVEAQGRIERILRVRDEWDRDQHALLVLALDGRPGLVAVPDCVRARSIAQAAPIGTRIMVEYRGWQPGRGGRMMRDLRIHVGRTPGAA